MRRSCCATLIAAVLSVPSVAQDQAPRFRGGIDLLTVDVTVLGAGGQSVGDLGAEDFTVTIAGQPRKVLAARFYGAGEAGPMVTPPSMAHASNAAAGLGRSVLFVIDRTSIQAGTEKSLINASATVLDALAAADAAGVVGLPAGRFELTREHARVRDSLRHMSGTMPATAWKWHITWDEAAGIERQDQQLLAQVLYRECRPARVSEMGEAPRVPEACDRGVVTQSMEMLLNARSQARATLANLLAIADGLAPLRGPKHIVLISGGLRFDQELLPEFDLFAEQAARAGVVLHVVHADQPATDSTTSRRPVTSPFGGRDMSAGLAALAGTTGGTFSQGVGSAAGVFARIATEVTHHYQLAIETAEADMSAGVRDITVAVNRQDVTVRARSRVAPPGGSGLHADALARLLQQPTDVAGLPIQVATYATRGDQPDRLRVLIAGEIAPGNPISGEWGFAVLNEGNAVATGRRTVTDDLATPWTISSFANLVPGRYRLRVAAIASDGRTGVLDVPLVAGLRAAGALQTSDLIVGVAESSRLQPRASIPAGTDLHVMLEVMSADADALGRARAAIEIIPAGTVEPVRRHLMAARSGPIGTIVLHEARVETTMLPPGRYSASAVVLLDDQPVGRVVRVFDVVAGASRQDRPPLPGRSPSAGRFRP